MLLSREPHGLLRALCAGVAGLALSLGASAQDAAPTPAQSTSPAGPAAATGEPLDVPAKVAAPRDLGFVELRVSYYDTEDKGDGNPFLDETETVIEGVIVFEVNLTDKLTVGGSASYDLVSSASIDRLSKFPEQSGASGDNYFGGELSLSYQWTDTIRLGGRVGGSQEYDYRSLSAGLDVSWDLFDKNTTLGVSVSGFLDSVDLILFDGSEDGTEDRKTVTLGLSLYQVLSPRLHMQAGYSLTWQEGYLETPYNAVVLEDDGDAPNPNLDNLARGIEVTEELPDTRIRHALYGSLRYYFDTGTALEGRLRLYADSWGIVSFAPELRVYQRIADDRFLLRFRYRYYQQTAADAFEDRFLVPPGDRAAFVANEERTQDSDLGDFSSHTIGIKLTWNIFEGHALSLGADYVLRSDGLDQVLLGVGWRWEF